MTVEGKKKQTPKAADRGVNIGIQRETTIGEDNKTMMTVTEENGTKKMQGGTHQNICTVDRPKDPASSHEVSTMTEHSAK